MKRTGPDSVDSWISAVCCCLVGMVLFGMVRLSGMLFVTSMEEFNTDREKASFPYILCDVTQALMGPFTGYYASKFGSKSALILGSFLAAVGIGANFLATSIGTVTILWGVVFGIGFGFCCPVLPIVITQHFVKKRATAIGFMYVGSYLGMAILPSVLEYLIENYGLKGTFLWLGGVILHCVPISMLLRNSNISKLADSSGNVIVVPPIINHLSAREKYIARRISVDDSNLGKIFDSGNNEMRSINEHVIKRNSKTISLNEKNNKFISRLNPFKSSNNVTQSSANGNQNGSAPERGIPTSKPKSQINHHDIFPLTSCIVRDSKLNQSSCKVTFHDTTNKDCHVSDKDPEICTPKGRKLSLHKMKPSEAFKVFFEPIFILVMLLNASFVCSFIAFMTIIVDFAKDIGLEFSDGKYIILGFSIASNVGLMSFGWVTDCGYLNVTNFSGILYLVRGVTLAIMPFSNGFSMFLSIAMFQGLAEASLGNLLPLIIAEYYSEEVHEVAISCSYILGGPVHLATPAIISYFRDGWGSYDYMFYSMSAASMLCGVLLFLAPLLAKCRCVKDERILRTKSISEPEVTA